MTTLPNCPKCESEYTYEDGDLFVCPMCAHEWTKAEAEAAEEANIIRDANGNPLADGDNVTVIKDLKLNGSTTIKQGTKAKGIRLVAEPVDGHDIQCKIDGIGSLYLKSIYVKK
ncbi:zinc ribbon domain-containing protein YjdM [Aerococcaceae bacterium NML191292]|nr:zinc ribbon domain-containing protein YjdM [Aerococcaceae bacterium NML210727]MCW6655015.1 zinc ribbon domain-containing protein YjdM [Aerococcaceae bacterium NML201296]MCW6659966.1 zinc ribbon domain-containing protein YjdM [Aerococcaceae bacterium NML191292]MCW6661748.1 zinc ribbon domain-containing protein YjdM [Aerococcaceae bacterium NML201209]MCW6665196.1 zinc ribbon domain-containing protein YjdM [Aerococcaceae bacterium NML191219]MCW6666821.1 zinc ribbon domain-containing protein Yj